MFPSIKMRLPAKYYYDISAQPHTCIITNRNNSTFWVQLHFLTLPIWRAMLWMSRNFEQGDVVVRVKPSIHDGVSYSMEVMMKTKPLYSQKARRAQ